MAPPWCFKPLTALVLSLFVTSSFLKPTGAYWYMPDESEPHVQTWMAFGPSKGIWGSFLQPHVQKNLADIALAIAEYEPVVVIVRERDLPVAKKLMGDEVHYLVSPLDDIWMRDTGPVFVVSEGGSLAAIDFNFNGWGEKQAFEQDAKIAGLVARELSIELIHSTLVLEGGSIEVDGQGTAIITESCVLNPNRNPGATKEQVELELKELLGLDKIIWLPGIAGEDITDGHTDFYARFAGPGVVLAGYEPNPKYADHKVTRKHLEILRNETDAQGNPLKVIVLRAPWTVRQKFDGKDFAAGYIGFYVVNGAVIIPEFGDKRADSAAKKAIQEAYPDRDVIQLNVDALAAGGGSIHCVTKQEPAANFDDEDLS